MFSAAELACVGIFLTYLGWVPLPFASITGAAFLPLTLPPLVLCSLAAALRSRDAGRWHWPASLRVWSTGGAAMLLIAILQLVPLPDGVLRILSPESHAIWSRAQTVATLAGQPDRHAHPITVDPAASRRELARLAALLATFLTAALLIHDNRRRVAFAIALGATGLFEALYGVQEAVMHRYEIWGWRNTLIYERASGTFVNPNHFASYLAMVIPFCVYLGLMVWFRAGNRPFVQRLSTLSGVQVASIGACVVVAVTCLGAILMSQSRGGLVALGGGGVIAFVIGLIHRVPKSGPASRGLRLALAGVLAMAAIVLLVFGLATYLGRERTLERFRTIRKDRGGLTGRSSEIRAAIRIWTAFPVVGSGAGTFESVVAIAQEQELDSVYQHAHNDYAEIAATMGTVGFATALGTLLAGFAAILRRLVIPHSYGSRRSRAFTLAAATSLTIVMIHALFDFNFFIPANATTITAIAGAVAAVHLKDRDVRRAGAAASRRR